MISCKLIVLSSLESVLTVLGMPTNGAGGGGGGGGGGGEEQRGLQKDISQLKPAMHIP